LFAAAGRGSIWHNANAVGTSFGVVGAFPPLFVGVPSFPIHRVVCGGAVDHFLLVKRSIHDGKRFGPMCWPGFVPPWQWSEVHWWHLVAFGGIWWHLVAFGGIGGIGGIGHFDM
jgi:hypothetical protein